MFEIFVRRCLAAALLFSIATWAEDSSSASKFTLQQLAAGRDFTIGSVRFFGWKVDRSSSTIDPANVLVTTNNNRTMPGFRADLPGNLGGEHELHYYFSVEVTNNQPIINGAVIEILESTLGKFSSRLGTPQTLG